MFPQKIHAKDRPAFSHENRDAPLPKFSARFDMFLSLPELLKKNKVYKDI